MVYRAKHTHLHGQFQATRLCVIILCGEPHQRANRLDHGVRKDVVPEFRLPAFGELPRQVAAVLNSVANPGGWQVVSRCPKPLRKCLGVLR